MTSSPSTEPGCSSGSTAAPGATATARACASDRERKRIIGVDAKQAIAGRAAALIPDGAALFLDVGTTMETVADALDTKSGLQVFTTNLRAALRFSHDRHEVYVIGGRLSGKDGSLTGRGGDCHAGVAAPRLGPDRLFRDRGRRSRDGFRPRQDRRQAGRHGRPAGGAGGGLLLAAAAKRGRSARAEIAPESAFHQVIDETGTCGSPDGRAGPGRGG